MAAAKKEEKQTREVVLNSFAYAKAKSGEVVALVKGDVVDADRFEKDSLEHLRSIGFVGSEK